MAFKLDDEWQREATAAAIKGARDAIGGDGINPRAMVSTLSEVEWGWIVCGAIFGWIKVKAEQARAEGMDVNITSVTLKGRDPEPWEAGAIEAILPELGAVTGIDWAKPIGEWSKPEIISFAWQIYRRTDAALAQRDVGNNGVVFNRDASERALNAKNGGSLTTRAEERDLADTLMAG